MIFEAQSNDYNCGVYATHYALKMVGVNVSIDEIEKVFCLDPEMGTSHTAIIALMESLGVPYSTHYDTPDGWIDSMLPAIINLQSEGDGHYVTFIGKSQTQQGWAPLYIYYDPADGEVKTIDSAELNRVWYSERYGRRWYCSVFLKS